MNGTLTRCVGLDIGRQPLYTPALRLAPMEGLARFLIVSGLVLVAVGAVVYASGRVPWLGRLPGDFVIRRDGFTFYFPLATSILASVVISLLLYLFRR